jgi:SAM-dependent methyltransferase
MECGLYADPELYDSLFPSGGESDRFYLEEARRWGGRVLELGCGSGRLTIPIAQAGLEVVGLDLSLAMLERARAKATEARLKVEFVEADMRSFDLPGKFSAILIPGNSLLHLHAIDDLKQCLESVRRHLAPGGRLIFDISKWPLTRFEAQRHPLLQMGDISVDETGTYDAAQQVRHIVWHFSKPGKPDYLVTEYWLRVIFPQELLLLLEVTGYRLEERYGEFPREPFGAASPRQVCICSVSGP